MMSNNKILTVSYGTFSCTLEGFEDSFDTMKAIAEYFRDLAADDRYFGAEPPQPDVEMLARIAEREVARRVEARISDAGVHLRTDSAAATALTAAQALQDVRMPDADIPDTPDDGVAPDASSDASNAASTSDATETAEQDNASEFTQASDDVAAEEVVPADIAESPAAAVMESVDTQIDETVEAQTDDVTEPVAAEINEADTYEDEIGQPDASDTIMSASMDFPMSGLTNEPTTAETPDEDGPRVDVMDDIAAIEPQNTAQGLAEGIAEPTQIGSTTITDKLRRIREVVARNHSGGTRYEEDQHAEEYAKTPNAAAQAEEPAELDDNVEDVETLGEAASEWDSYEEDLQEEDTSLSDTDVFDELEDDLSSQNSSDIAAEPVASINDDIKDATTDAEQLTTPDTPDRDETEQAMPVPPIGADRPTPPTDAATRAETAVRRRVRVIKVKQAEIKTPVENVQVNEAVADDDIRLSDDEENELLRELAEVEAELAAETKPDEVSASSELHSSTDVTHELSNEDTAEFDDSAADASAARLLEQAAGEEEDALDRLMAEADSQMEEPESTSRRSAFSHLRAAVAATKADDKLSEAAQAPGDADYRTDLAAAVKPRRPTAEGNRTLRPSNERPAPLKLVAEQRVDSPQGNTGPVQPRRVSANVEKPEDDDGTFAQYAEARGAKELPEVLEAAASYLRFVEGREQFSRPQLMTKVRQLGLEDFTREDGLRHFGQLLRAGKIEKIKGGRFTVSEDIGFRPDPDDQRQVG